MRFSKSGDLLVKGGGGARASDFRSLAAFSFVPPSLADDGSSHPPTIRPHSVRPLQAKPYCRIVKQPTVLGQPHQPPQDLDVAVGSAEQVRLARAVGRLHEQFQHVDGAIRKPLAETNRWFFGKRSTRSRNHFTTSYHSTSKRAIWPP